MRLGEIAGSSLPLANKRQHVEGGSVSGFNLAPGETRNSITEARREIPTPIKVGRKLQANIQGVELSK